MSRSRIATSPVASGGLALFAENSAEYCALFNQAPPAIIDERPSCHMEFLAWLVPRHELLRQLSQKDQQQRKLEGKQLVRGINALNEPDANAFRAVELVLVMKSLYLFHKIKASPYLAASEYLCILCMCL
jgi:hypothetical protein